MSGRLPVALATSAVLLATLAWQVHGFARPSLGAMAGRSTVPARASDPPGLDVNDVAQGWVGTALERPLFRGDRRPARAPDDLGPKADEPMRLTGVITGPFGNRAIFMSAKGAKPIVVGEGARVGNFVVRSIEPGRALVELGGDVRILKPTFAEAALPVRR